MYYSNQCMVKQYLKKHKNLIEGASISHLEDLQDHMQFNICIEDNLEKLDQSNFYMSSSQHQRTGLKDTSIQMIP